MTDPGQYLWYCPEQACFCIQWIMRDCYINFEFDPDDAVRLLSLGIDDPMIELSWVALGEL